MNYRVAFYSAVGLVTLLSGTLLYLVLGADTSKQGLSGDEALVRATDSQAVDARMAALEQNLAEVNRTLRDLQDLAAFGASADAAKDFSSDDLEPLTRVREPGAARPILGGEDQAAKAEERYAELQEAFATDPLGDAEEATRMEVDIEQLFAEGGQGGLKLEGVECRSSQCKIDYQTAGEYWDEEIEELEMSAALAGYLGGKAHLRYGRQEGEKKTLYVDLTSGSESEADWQPGPAEFR